MMTVRTPTQLTDLNALAEAAECLRTLAHPHRLRIVQMLLGRALYRGRTGRSVRHSQPLWPRNICG